MPPLSRRDFFHLTAGGAAALSLPFNRQQIAQNESTQPMTDRIRPSQLTTTYSITALDPDTGQLGVAVQTHQMSVGSIVPWLRPGVGAVATQSLVNVSYGPQGLDLLAAGQSPQQAIDALTTADSRSFHRQVAITGADGRTAAFTGELCIANAGHHAGDGYTVQANMMANNTVISAMRYGYERTSGNLAERMLGALQSAEAEGGDIRGKQSAALRVVPPGGPNVPAWATVYDLRVDESDNPLDELARLVRLRRAKLLSDQGELLFAAGNRADALRVWEEARRLAPDLEEIAFWQALTLADGGNDVAAAAALFNETFTSRDDREQWMMLVDRLEAARLIQREGAAAEFIEALRA